MKKSMFIGALMLCILIIGCGSKEPITKDVKKDANLAVTEVVNAVNNVVIKVPKDGFLLFYFNYKVDFDSIRSAMNRQGYDFASGLDLKKFVASRERRQFVSVYSDKSLPIIAVNVPGHGNTYEKEASMYPGGYLNFRCLIFNGKDTEYSDFPTGGESYQNYWFLAAKISPVEFVYK